MPQPAALYVLGRTRPISGFVPRLSKSMTSNRHNNVFSLLQDIARRSPRVAWGCAARGRQLADDLGNSVEQRCILLACETAHYVMATPSRPGPMLQVKQQA